MKMTVHQQQQLETQQQHYQHQHLKHNRNGSVCKKSDCIDHICMIHTHVLCQCVVIVLVGDQNDGHIFHRDISYTHDLFLNVLLRCQKYNTVFDILHKRSTLLSNSRFYTHALS